MAFANTQLPLTLKWIIRRDSQEFRKSIEISQGIAIFYNDAQKFNIKRKFVLSPLLQLNSFLVNLFILPFSALFYVNVSRALPRNFPLLLKHWETCCIAGANFIAARTLKNMHTCFAYCTFTFVSNLLHDAQWLCGSVCVCVYVNTIYGLLGEMIANYSEILYS